MKLNWGGGIAAVYIIFMIGVLILVFIFMNQEVTLETNDYYFKGVEYQKQIDKIKRTNELPEQLTIIQNELAINFQFPKIFSSNDIGGTIDFYRPSDDNKDFSIKINTDTSRSQSIAAANLDKGLWKIKVDWLAKGNSYYNEKILMVN